MKTSTAKTVASEHDDIPHHAHDAAALLAIDDDDAEERLAEAIVPRVLRILYTSIESQVAEQVARQLVKRALDPAVTHRLAARVLELIEKQAAHAAGESSK